jgi:hypothetical protein
MGQVLRVTVGQADYAFKLLDWTRGELEIEFSGKVCKLKREGRNWISTDGLEPQLAEAIGKSVALRYRI